jgi:hypothetical protein
MRIGSFIRILAVLAAGFSLGPARAQEAFDACEVFTVEDAQKVLGPEAAADPVNPKAKRPKVIPTCTYHATKDGAKVAATANFRWGKTNEDTQKAFEESRLQFQTKPMLISGAEAFWAGKQGEMMLRKGRTWLTLSVGPAVATQRDLNEARRLAEILVKKL